MVVMLNFMRRLGKVLRYDGYQDAIVPPLTSPRHYHAVMANRSDAETPISDFYRLFMVPGLAYCSSGDGACVRHLLRCYASISSPFVSDNDRS